MPLDPTLVKPMVTFDPGSPIDRMTGAVTNALNMEKMRTSGDERRSKNALAEAYRAAYAPGGAGRAAMPRELASRGAGASIPAWMKNESEIGENEAQAAHAKMNAMGKFFENQKHAMNGVSFDPKVGPLQYLTVLENSHGDLVGIAGEEGATKKLQQRVDAAKQAVREGKWEAFLRGEALGIEKANEQLTNVIHQGNQDTVTSTPRFGNAPKPTVVGQFPINVDPNTRLRESGLNNRQVAQFGHADASQARQFDHADATQARNLDNQNALLDKRFENDRKKVTDKEIAERTKAAALIVREAAIQGLGGMLTIHPETAQIEITGAQPMSPVMKRKLDQLVYRLGGGRLLEEPGQNPRLILEPGTTAASVNLKLKPPKLVVGPNNTLVAAEVGAEVRGRAGAKPPDFQKKAESLFKTLYHDGGFPVTKNRIEEITKIREYLKSVHAVDSGVPGATLRPVDFGPGGVENAATIWNIIQEERKREARINRDNRSGVK